MKRVLFLLLLIFTVCSCGKATKVAEIKSTDKSIETICVYETNNDTMYLSLSEEMRNNVRHTANKTFFNVWLMYVLLIFVSAYIGGKLIRRTPDNMITWNLQILQLAMIAVMLLIAFGTQTTLQGKVTSFADEEVVIVKPDDIFIIENPEQQLYSSDNFVYEVDTKLSKSYFLSSSYELGSKQFRWDFLWQLLLIILITQIAGLIQAKVGGYYDCI